MNPSSICASPQANELRRARDEIGERRRVENVEKRPLRVAQHPLQAARLIDGTCVRLAVEALDEVQVRFGGADQRADVDLGGRAIQPEAAAASPRAGDE